MVCRSVTLRFIFSYLFNVICFIPREFKLVLWFRQLLFSLVWNPNLWRYYYFSEKVQSAFQRTDVEEVSCNAIYYVDYRHHFTYVWISSSLFHMLIICQIKLIVKWKQNCFKMHFCISHRDQLALLYQDIPQIYVEILKDGLSDRITIHSPWI